MQSKLKIFVGSAIAQTRADFKVHIADIKKRLSEEFEVLEAADEAASPQENYRKSIQECVAGCDIYLAVCDIPAIGLGYELGTALEKYSKPTIAVAKGGSDVSKLIQGIDHPAYEFRRCESVDEILAAVREKRMRHYPPATAVAEDVCDVCVV